MQHNIKQINHKNCPCYLFNDIVNDMVKIKNFNPRLEINKLSFKSVFRSNIYYINYNTMQSPDYVNIDDSDFLYFIFNNVDGCIEEKNGIIYQVFTSIDENKESLKNYTKLWKETKSQNKAISNVEPNKYRKDFMKFRFESDNDLPLGKTHS